MEKTISFSFASDAMKTADVWIETVGKAKAALEMKCGGSFTINAENGIDEEKTKNDIAGCVSSALLDLSSKALEQGIDITYADVPFYTDIIMDIVNKEYISDGKIKLTGLKIDYYEPADENSRKLSQLVQKMKELNGPSYTIEQKRAVMHKLQIFWWRAAFWYSADKDFFCEEMGKLMNLYPDFDWENYDWDSLTVD